MTWRVARSLDQLLAQLNALAPNRSRASDGSIGDEAHQSQGSASDHNPWYGPGIVTARDYTHDPANGLDCNKLAAALIASRDPRIKYLIWQGRICDSRPQFNPWQWMPSSGHFQHLHLSVMANATADDPRPWFLPGLTAPEEDDVLTKQQDAWLVQVRNQVDELNRTLISGVKRDTKYNDDLGYVQKNVMDAVGKVGAAVAQVGERVSRLETAGVPVTVDYDRLATAVVDLMNKQARDGDPTTGPVS